MQQLLAMARPLEQAVTYHPDGRPAAVASDPAGKGGGVGGGGVMRTVFLPAGGNGEALALKIESLQAQLQEQVRRGSRAPGPAAAGQPRWAVWHRTKSAEAGPATHDAPAPSPPPHRAAQRALAEERVEALLADRRVRQQEEERHRANGMLQVRRAPS
jgi:hypothetical protein